MNQISDNMIDLTISISLLRDKESIESYFNGLRDAIVRIAEIKQQCDAEKSKIGGRLANRLLGK